MTTEYAKKHKKFPTFKDFPDLYRKRITRMYRKASKSVFACPEINNVNHLVGICPLCKSRGVLPSKVELISTFRGIDRKYTVHKDPWEKHCLRSLTNLGRHVYTNLEFPIPKIVYRGQTRIPLFYDPLNNSFIDCFPTFEEVGTYSGYFTNHIIRFIHTLGFVYERCVIDKHRKVTYLETDRK
jgi:hypothetical protein